MTLVTVLGAGGWGTTLANLLAAKGERVRIWAYEQEVVEAINQRHENPVFLSGVQLGSGTPWHSATRVRPCPERR